jgi:hypothetical protein
MEKLPEILSNNRSITTLIVISDEYEKNEEEEINIMKASVHAMRELAKNTTVTTLCFGSIPVLINSDTSRCTERFL